MARFEHYGVVVTPEDFKGADWIGLCRRYGLRTLGLHSGGGAGADVLTMLGRYATDSFRNDVQAAGLEHEYECHASASLLPPSLAAEHPEYFAYDNRYRRRRNDSNWCVSDAAAQVEFHKNARLLVAQLPSATHRYMLWNADVPRVYCHCPDCAKLTPSDQALLAVNQLARAAREADPQAMVSYLAYMELLEPPRQVVPEPNVFLEFAPIERCLEHSIDDGDCAVNRSMLAKLRQLLEIFPARTAHVLDYYLDSSYFSCYSKPAVEVWTSREVMARDFDCYASLGIRSLSTFAVYMDGEYFRRHGEAALEAYATELQR